MRVVLAVCGIVLLGSSVAYALLLAEAAPSQHPGIWTFAALSATSLAAALVLTVRKRGRGWSPRWIGGLLLLAAIGVWGAWSVSHIGMY